MVGKAGASGIRPFDVAQEEPAHVGLQELADPRQPFCPPVVSPENVTELFAASN